MWGKVSFHRTRKPSSESPLPPVGTHGYRSSSLSTKQNSDSYTKALPTLLSNSPGSHFAPHQPEPNPRVASSIYSRDTAVFDHLPQRSVSDTYQLSPQHSSHGPDYAYSQGTRSVEISPPDSPVPRTSSRASSAVSPMEDEPKQPTSSGGNGQMGSTFASHIPVLRKRVDSQPNRLHPLRNNPTRWDDFSGEPTRSKLGRVGQVAPSTVSFETHISAAPPPSYSSNIFGWGKDHFTSRKKAPEVRSRFYKSDEATPFAPREPWKGRSGRSPIVNPIQEKPRSRSSSRLGFSRGSDRLRERNTPSPGAGIVTSTITTTITAGAGNNVNQVSRMDPYDAREAETPISSASSVISGSAPPRVDLPETELDVGLADLKLSADNDDDVGEPRSRFSVTTYEPTDVGSSTPSPRLSIDTASQSSEKVPSIMSRSRPIPSTVAPGKQPTRKPTPSEVSANKYLPQPPTEVTPQNRIEMLEARRNELVRRRTNIDTIIHELTQVIQPSSIAYDMAARDEVKKTVASLNNELAEIKKEEHDIGLKLLRAWKKRDASDIYGQNTSFWVKRVTS